MSKDYLFIHVAPIQYNESQQYHLLIVTKNGYRIYIRFLNKNKQDCNNMKGSDKDAQELDDRFSSNWEIASAISFPNDSIIY